MKAPRHERFAPWEAESGSLLEEFGVLLYMQRRWSLRSEQLGHGVVELIPAVGLNPGCPWDSR